MVFKENILFDLDNTLVYNSFITGHSNNSEFTKTYMILQFLTREDCFYLMNRFHMFTLALTLSVMGRKLSVNTKTLEHQLCGLYVHFYPRQSMICGQKVKTAIKPQYKLKLSRSRLGGVRDIALFNISHEQTQ